MKTTNYELRTTNRLIIIAAALMVAVTLFRFWYCQQLELIGDEAYYWYCSRHLDWSFFDKGPGAAVTIFFGTKLFGDTVLGVRFFAVLLSAGTGIGLFVLASLLYDRRVAFWTLLVALFMPLYAVGSILMTIDPISIFFWTWAAIAFWCAKKNSGIFFWILTGALVGIGMLAKYTNLVELICFALFCAWSPKGRSQFARPYFYLMVATAIVCSFPMVIWNFQHHGIAIVHLLKRGDLNSSWSIKPSELLVFLGAQAGVYSPLFFLGIITSVFFPRSLSDEYKREETCFLRSLFIPLFLFYSILSLNKAAEPNWTAPCYVAGMILLVGNWKVLVHRFPWAKSFAAWAIALAAFETVLLHNTFWLHLPIPSRWEEEAQGVTKKILTAYKEVGKVDPLDRAHGSESIARHAAQLAQEQGTAFFISDNYQTASLLTFYLPGHPDTYESSCDYVKDQFSIWPGYRDLFPAGARALFVYPWKYGSRELQRDFSKITIIDEAYSMAGDRPMRKYYYSVCDGLKK
ncbi:MAG: ArnT family glycosyltransferase [Chthoniobacterales bacterium]